jgi:hypothetical protein
MAMSSSCRRCKSLFLLGLTLGGGEKDDDDDEEEEEEEDAMVMRGTVVVTGFFIRVSELN